MTEPCRKHDWRCLPASDPDDELPAYCINGDCGMIKWGNGEVWHLSKWNAFYKPNGELLDPEQNPSANNPGWVGHK